MIRWYWLSEAESLITTRILLIIKELKSLRKKLAYLKHTKRERGKLNHFSQKASRLVGLSWKSKKFRFKNWVSITKRDLIEFKNCKIIRTCIIELHI